MNGEHDTIDVPEALAAAALAFIEATTDRIREERGGEQLLRKVRALLSAGGHGRVTCDISPDVIALRLVIVDATGTATELASSRLVRRGLGNC